MNDIHFPSPPDWSLQVGELGKFLVVGSTALFAISFLAWLFGSKSELAQKVAKWSFSLGCLAIFGTIISLGVLFANNRFEYAYVWEHADKSNLLQYRIAGIWSGQQGSFLLWATTSAIFGIIIARRTGKYRRWFTIAYSAFLGALCGILAYESPFVLNMIDGRPIVPPDGRGLAPSLQNYWVVIHPPTIFLGFGSLTALFALALAATIERDFDSWIPIVRPWAIVSTTLVGLGLCMGGFWAYETLGWGGFWMWDPVENVSFVPWCLSAGFVHGIIVQATRKRWRTTNLLLGALPFLAFVYGTFLTRSGLLADASVHSFAEMNRSALKLLVGLMGLMTFGFLAIWSVRKYQARNDPQGEPGQAFHREGFYKTGTILLIGLGITALLGMSVPLVMALSGKKPSVVEEHAYHLVIPWLFIPLMVLMALAPFVSWRGIGFRDLGKRAYSIICVVVGICGCFLLAMAASPLGKLADLGGFVTFPGGLQVKSIGWIMFLVGVCLFALIGNAWRMLELVKGTKVGLAPFIMHVGVTILMLGLIVSRGFERHEQALVMDDHPGETSSYLIKYVGQTSTDKYNRNNKAKFEVYDKNDVRKPLFLATPGLYYVRNDDGSPDSVMVWPHIQHSPTYDVYMALQPPQTQAGDPISLAPGKSTVVGGLVVTYLEMVRHGEPGMAGTTFGAKLRVEGGGKSVEVTPKMELGSGSGPIQLPAKLDNSMSVSLMGMDAATHTVTIQMSMNSMIYPIQIYHKPFTGLVWLGAGIMTLGGFLSAYYRRKTRVAERSESVTKEKIEKEELLISA